MTDGYKASMDDPKKLPHALIPKSFFDAASRALQDGARKYAPHNWRKGLPQSEVYSALQRHLLAYWDGEDIDAESGLHHLDGAAANLIFLIEYAHRPDIYGIADDRWKRQKGVDPGGRMVEG